MPGWPTRRGMRTPAPASPTVLEAGEQWIAQAETDGLERATVRQYRQHLDLHIKPFLGHHKLCDLTPGAIQSFRMCSSAKADRACW